MNARLKVFVVPIGVVTVTFLALRVAAVVITQFALTVVEVDVIPVQVTFLPKMATAVAPVKLIPARATGTVVHVARFLLTLNSYVREVRGLFSE